MSEKCRNNNINKHNNNNNNSNNPLTSCHTDEGKNKTDLELSSFSPVADLRSEPPPPDENCHEDRVQDGSHQEDEGQQNLKHDHGQIVTDHPRQRVFVI